MMKGRIAFINKEIISPFIYNLTINKYTSNINTSSNNHISYVTLTATKIKDKINDTNNSKFKPQIRKMTNNKPVKIQ